MNRQILQIAVGSVVLIGAFYFGSLAQRKHGDLIAPGSSTEPLANEDLVWHTPTTRHEIGTTQNSDSQQPLTPANRRPGESSESPSNSAQPDSGLSSNSDGQVPVAVSPKLPVKKVVQPDFSRFDNSVPEESSASSQASEPTPLLPVDRSMGINASPRPPVTVTARRPATDDNTLGQSQANPGLPESSADWELGGEIPDLLPKRRPTDDTVLEQPAAWAPTDLVPFSLNRDELEIESESFRIHITRHGDTLQSLARQYYGKPDFYLDIYLANQDSLESPIHLPVGKSLKIPDYSDRDR